MKRIGILVLLVAVVSVAQFGASATPANAQPQSGIISVGGPVLSAPVAGAHSTCNFTYFNVAVSGLVIGDSYNIGSFVDSSFFSPHTMGTANATSIPRFTYLVYNDSTTALSSGPHSVNMGICDRTAKQGFAESFTYDCTTKAITNLTTNGGCGS